MPLAPHVIDIKKSLTCHLVAYKRWVIFFNGIQGINSIKKGEETRETEEKNEGKWDSIKFGQIRPNLKTLKILHVELSEECQTIE